MSTFVLNINGENKTVEVDGETPLLWVLRDNLQLTGTKYSCGIGICGNCTVHIDGIAEQSCAVPIKKVVSRPIITIEGLAQNPSHPILKTWIDQEVSQCGYCQPGQIMTLASLLYKNPKPSTTEVEETMSSVLCRCGTYPRIKKAIETLINENVG